MEQTCCLKVTHQATTLIPKVSDGLLELPLARLISICDPLAALPKFKSIAEGEFPFAFAPARLISICDPPTFRSITGEPFAPPRLMTISGVPDVLPEVGFVEVPEVEPDGAVPAVDDVVESVDGAAATGAVAGLASIPDKFTTTEGVCVWLLLARS